MPFGRLKARGVADVSTHDEGAEVMGLITSFVQVTARVPRAAHALGALGLSAPRARQSLRRSVGRPSSTSSGPRMHHSYSALSAWIGSTRNARRAGITFASNAIVMTTMTAADQVTGSAAPMPYSAPATIRVANAARRSLDRGPG